MVGKQPSLRFFARSSASPKSVPPSTSEASTGAFAVQRLMGVPTGRAATNGRMRSNSSRVMPGSAIISVVAVTSVFATVR